MSFAIALTSSCARQFGTIAGKVAGEEIAEVTPVRDPVVTPVTQGGDFCVVLPAMGAPVFLTPAELATIPDQPLRVITNINEHGSANCPNWGS